jgi:hypothetical protein
VKFLSDLNLFSNFNIDIFLYCVSLLKIDKLNLNLNYKEENDRQNNILYKTKFVLSRNIFLFILRNTSRNLKILFTVASLYNDSLFNEFSV